MAGKRQPGADPRPRTEAELIGKIIDELTKAYPNVEKYVDERPEGAGGSAGGRAVPLNLDAYVFVHGRYWVAPIDPKTESPYPIDQHTSTRPCTRWSAWSRAQDRLAERTGIGAPVPRCWTCAACVETVAVRACQNPGCGARRDNWQRGLKLTIFYLEAEIRQTLGFGPVSRARAAGIYPSHGTDLRVLDALAYIRTASHTLAEDHPDWARWVLDELARINARCKGMIDGHSIQVVVAGRPPLCEFCGLDTVHSNRDQAVCANPECTTEDGSRHCWNRDSVTGAWIEVPEPGDRRGRGRNLTHEQLLKWAPPPMPM